MFYNHIGPVTDWSTGKIFVNCPHCGSKVVDPKHTIIRHKVKRTHVGFLCLFPTYSYETVEKDGFTWNCCACKASFTTRTLDITTGFIF